MSVFTLWSNTWQHETVYNFMAATTEEKIGLRQQVITAFNQADVLCAYNAVMFDIPFIQKQLDIDIETIQDWLIKLFDPFHAMRTCFSITCKLDRMLALNGMECKSGDGEHAIGMAHAGEWEALSSYCMDDVRLTVALCQCHCLKLFQDEIGIVLLFFLMF